ncbi:PDR/VanB family oxidoreductase [Actinokineospora iranica]|uniref:Ferredoxin-NADP reductase n=1 Tax=Actinokineospora iranica TaxID=1271860 RepID=A0A1G6RES8_9PSEU|nr:PDR/VanB family oxidoreductase [Actinokineospora iranica]SDD02555.1 Ferredoxin-NADP reductase [Actinokineospora iranica]
MVFSGAGSGDWSAPPDLYGRPRADRAMLGVARVVSGVLRLSRRGVRRQPVVRPVDRDLRLVVRAVTAEADGVVSLRLADPAGAALPPWRPGGHLDVVLPSGRCRQYSLCGDPADRLGYRIAVRLVPNGGGGSVEIHSSVGVGDVLTVRGPRTAFPFVGRGPYLFVAGGIGITPILPMVHAAERAGADWRLVYTGRTRASMPFLDELPGDERVSIVEGMPTAAELLATAPEGASVYLCGPPPMVAAVRGEWGGALHFERFSAAPVVNGKPFEMQVGVGGPVVPVAADETALTALLRVRPDAAYSCRQGFCGTCEVKVAAGAVDGRGRALSEEDSMLVCVSRAVGDRLVLDV